MKSLRSLFFIIAIVQSLNVVYADTSLKLWSNYSIPAIGLGTHGIKNDDAETIIFKALEIGYRLFDTGFVYGNEEGIGRGLKKWFDQGGKREDVFVTTKLPMYGNRASDVEKYLKISLERLGLDYVDLYLIHFPFGFMPKNDSFGAAKNPDGTFMIDYDTDLLGIWKEMEKQVKEGRIKSIGISNFNETQILNIINEAEIKPSNLEVEVHGQFQQKELREFCAQHNIVVTAYAPLGSPGARQHFHPEQSLEDFPDLLHFKDVRDIAAKYGKTNAQILLRHLTQVGLVAIPKSSNPDRMRENIEIFDFELSDEDIKKLEALDKGPAGRIFSYNVYFKGVEKHPEYPFPIEVKS